MSGFVFVAGCGDKGEVFEVPEENQWENLVEIDIKANRLEGLPGEVYRDQADSRIKWQPWTEGSLKLAKNSGRLVLALIVMPQQPSFKELLSKLSKSEIVVEQINASYIPVLIDGDAAREIGILTADLCAEIGSGLQLPLVVWMTPDANPVAWIPLPATNLQSIEEEFLQSHSMVSRMWMEDEGYVNSNSMIDQKNRRKRMVERRGSTEVSVEPAADAVRALRQLTSLYDPLSRTFDEAGGLFPAGSLELLSLGARMEAIPEDIRERSRTILEFLLVDLIQSPMFDALDGGVFSSRQGLSWELPGFYRDCTTQARVATSLLDAYGVTNDQEVLDAALGVLKFAEERFRTAEGLFCLGSESGGTTESWLWRMEEVREVLTEKELVFWVLATGMKDMGNLPSEVDPLRRYFRANSFRVAKSAAVIAEETGFEVGEVSELLSSSRRKLLKARSERLRHTTSLAEANAAASFRMVSAYSAAYRVTGDEKFRSKALEVLSAARQSFSDGPRLKVYSSDAAPSLVAARGFVYAVALQAILDVAAISLDESWLSWADDLATTTAEVFSADGYLRECPSEADLIGLPISDSTMVFDDSTAGLISMIEARMEALGRPMLKSFADLATGLPIAAITTPILHTDRIQGSLMRAYGSKLVFGAEIDGEFKNAISRVAPKITATLMASSVQGVSSDEVVRIGVDGTKFPIPGPENIDDHDLRESTD